MLGPEVGNWQRFLTRLGFDDGAAPLASDEDFGPKTIYATKNFQASEQLPTSGVVDLVTYGRAIDQGFIPFLRARNFNELWRPHAVCRSIDLITIHTSQNAPAPGEAKNVALWFANQPANGTPDPKTGEKFKGTSAHYCVDSDRVFQCVRDADIAWHAEPNAHSIGIELATMAASSAADWGSLYHESMLTRAAELVAELAKTHKVPIQRLSVAELRAGNARGICGHVDLTDAFAAGKGHVDPGPSFPWDHFLELAQKAFFS